MGLLLRKLSEMYDVMSVPTKYKNQATLHLIDEKQRGA